MSNFNINEFRSSGLTLEGARPTLYRVNLAFPAGLLNNDLAGEKLTFLCRATKFPESIINEIQVPYMGRTIKIFGNRQFEDWDITIINDEDFAIRNAFESWHNAINSIESNIMNPDFISAYKTVGSVSQFAKSGPPSDDNAIKTYNFDGIFPVLISDIPLDYEARDRVEEFQVRLAYDWYVPTTTPGGTPLFPVDTDSPSQE